MGRSVWTHNDAIATVYRTIENVMYICSDCETENNENAPDCPGCGADLYDESGESAQFEFDCLVDDIRGSFKRKFPSMRNCDHWPERESRAIVENDHCMIVISEYCGLVSIGVVPTGLWEAYYTPNSAPLAFDWATRYAAPFLRQAFGQLRKIGTASNGESFYERV